MKTEPERILLYWLPVVVLCAAIFVQSCFASPDLGPTFPMKDKVLHMTAYGVLAALFYRACGATWPGRMSPVLMLVVSVLFASLYGVSDELHQSLVAARHADVGDGIADFAGSILGAGATMIVNAKRGRWGVK